MKLKNTIIVLLYLALMALMVSWQDHQNTPNTMYRLAFLGISIIPAFFYRKYKYVPIIITLFFTVNYFGTALSYYPTYTYYYTGIAFMAYLFVAGDRRTFNGFKRITPPWPLVVIVPLALVVDFVTGMELTDTMFSSLFLLICCTLFPYDTDNNTLWLFKLAFIISSFIISVEFFTVGQKFVTAYGEANMDRERWTDPNYLGCVVGMGTVLAAIELLSKNKKHFIITLFYIATIGISVAMLIMNASRGALLATAVGIGFYTLVSKSSMWVKILTVVVGGLFLNYLYNNSYFDLLEVRMESNLDTGSGRTDIWAKKLDYFWSKSNPLQWLFGYGCEGGVRLGYGYRRGFHNEFLAMLVEYGIVGFVCFISLVFYPLKKSKYNKDVVVLELYFIIVCLTLEPMTSGYITYFCFLLLLILMSNSVSIKSYFANAK